MPLPSLKPAVASVKPLGKYLLVRRDEEEKAIGKILLPSNMARIDLGHGVVLDTGSRVEGIGKGDTVYFRRANGYHRVELPDGQAMFVPVDEIHAKS